MATESRDYTETTETGRGPTISQTMVEAITQEVRENEEVLYVGKDVANYDGIFSSTTDLLDEFSRNRVIDVPISETTYLDTAAGVAQAGMRPIAELMFVDFFSVAMDQIYSNMAKNTYMSGGSFSIPVVLTTAVGGTYNDANQHSQTLYGTFTHLPGMKVAVPSTAYDAKGLMHTTIRDDDPVVYMFHNRLMGLGRMLLPSGLETGVSEEDYTTSFGEADVKRPGNGVTVVTLSLHVHRAVETAERPDDDGIDAEVIDLRTLAPLDAETVLSSIRKTGKFLVVDEDYRSFGVTGEAIARATKDVLDDLSTVKRLATHDVPIPYVRPLEDEVNPGTNGITTAVRELHG